MQEPQQREQLAVLLPAGQAAIAEQTRVPMVPGGGSGGDSGRGDLAAVYASLLSGSIQVDEVPLSRLLLVGESSDDSLMLVVHAASLTTSDAPCSKDNRNRLASEVLACRAIDVNGVDGEEQQEVRGPAYILYASRGRPFTPRRDWEPLHDVIYGARLSNLGSSSSSGGSSSSSGARKTSGGGLSRQDMDKLVKEYREKRDAVDASKGVDAAMDDGTGIEGATDDDDNDDEEEGGWEDVDEDADEEDVRRRGQPRSSKSATADSDDQDTEEEENDDEDEDEDEDSNGSYEDDESELESGDGDDDDDDDPRKKALLDMIKKALTTDGKLDLERLGLVEKNGKLVPKDT